MTSNPKSNKPNNPKLNISEKKNQIITDSEKEEDSQRPHKQETKPGASLTLDTVQKALETISGLIALSYLAGFLIVNTSLYTRFGIEHLNPLNARYLATGLIYIFFAGSVYMYGIARENIFSGFFLGLVLTAINSMLIPLFLAVIYVPAGYSLELFLGIVSWALLSTVAVQDAAIAYLLWRKPPEKQPYMKGRILSPIRVMFIFVALLIYARDVYPHFSSSIGGGAPITVHFVTGKEQSKELEELVPLRDEYHTVLLNLLDQTTDQYIISVPNASTVGETAILVNKDLVKGIVYPIHTRPFAFLFNITTPILSTPTNTITPTSTLSPTFTATP